MDKIKSYVINNSDISGSLKTLQAESARIGKIALTFDRCPINNKIETNRANLIRLRALFGVGATGAGLLGLKVLPLIGFDVTGVIPASLASAYQSSIGNVAAGSAFAILQSLGATGMGNLIFGSVAVGLTGLADLVTENKLDWCTCQYYHDKYQSQL
ncbi:hypothetical protein Bhyg_07018 [Pseudolycoriella hygida]|uniref:Uncharacterized protein n=1 Tax=Pseudolycoriella hygida TaxID=35572 RepID=A0A9Q0S1L3_9DIPT|nr:hypothetical protein Bhyg_07018 [Pseudolycoriella hygida]